MFQITSYPRMVKKCTNFLENLAFLKWMSLFSTVFSLKKLLMRKAKNEYNHISSSCIVLAIKNHVLAEQLVWGFVGNVNVLPTIKSADIWNGFLKSSSQVLTKDDLLEDSEKNLAKTLKLRPQRNHGNAC